MTKYKNKLEELNNNPFIKQNYGHEDERSFKFASKSKHLFFDEICIIEDIQNAQRQYLWKEFFVEDKRGLLEIIAICELRMELQRNNNLGLVPLFRYMYKEVPHGWMSSRFRIRVLLEWNPNPGQFIADKIANYDRVKPTTAFIRTFFTNMLSVLTHLHKEEIFIIDLRPEYIICDETNNQQPFRLFDRLVEGVDPIKRIANSLLREKQESLQVKPPAQSTGTSEHYKSLSYKFAAPGRDVPESLRFVRKNEIRSIAWIMVFAVLGLKAFDLFDANNKVDDQMLKEGLAKLKELGSQEVADIVERILREEDIYKLSIKDSYLTVAQAPKTNAK